MGFFTLLFVGFFSLLAGFITGRRSSPALPDTFKPENFFKEEKLRGETDDDVLITIYDKETEVNAYTEPDGSLKYAKIQNVVVLIPGAIESTGNQSEYAQTYCETLKDSYFKYDNYSLLCYDWKPVGEDVNGIIALAQEKGQSLARLLKKKFKGMVKKFHLVAHDLGCIVAQIAAKNAFQTLDFVFGLDQRTLNHPNSSTLYLSKETAKTVQAIYSEYSTLPEVHRNFYFVPKGKDSKKFNIYEAYGKAVLEDGALYSGVSCPSADDFKSGKCDKNQKEPLWSNEFVRDPDEPKEKGNFYISRD